MKEDGHMKQRKRRMILLMLSVCMFFCSACSMDFQNKSQNKKQNVVAVQGTGKRLALPGAQKLEQAADSEESEAQNLPDDEIYVIMENDLYNHQLTLCDLSKDMNICYEYTDGTEFFDKYGNYALAEKFSEGKLVQIKRLNSNDTLGAVSFTDKTWDYEKAANYSLDTAKGILTIADVKYRCDPGTKVFTNEGQADVYTVGEGDVLDIYGEGRTVHSIVVRNGYGKLILKNTKLFEGGWLNLGTQVYTVILKNMEMDIPEGVYDFSVANDGYGDSGQIRIQRGKTTTIDLNDYKGEGPKLCRLKFHVGGVEGAVLVLDGKKVDVKQPLDVKYGVHTLSVSAAGYDTWTKQIVANSPKADIEIKLNNASDSSSGTSDRQSSGNTSDKNQANSSSTNRKSGNTARAGSKAGSLAGTYAGTDSGNSSGTGSNNSSASALANAALSSSLVSAITGGKSSDYLDTLSNLVDSLERLNKSSSSSDDDDD